MKCLSITLHKPDKSINKSILRHLVSTFSDIVGHKITMKEEIILFIIVFPIVISISKNLDN